MNTNGALDESLDESRPTQLSSDVARRFGVVPQTVLYWVKTGRLRARRTERGIHLFDPKDVDAFAIAREMQAGE